MTVERVSRDDLTELASETPTGPMQIAAILRLRTPIPADEARHALAQRIPRVARLRQRLVRTPVGSGRPIWVDDPRFDVSQHVRRHSCDNPADEATVLEVAAHASFDPLPRDRPLWRVTLITDCAGRCSALLLVVHHVVADGISGLGALLDLSDQGSPEVPTAFPMPAPCPRELRHDAMSGRLAALRSVPRAAAQLSAARAELGGLRARGAHGLRAQPCALNRPIGRDRRLATARIGLADTAAAAHAAGGTINDILLTAVAGALHATLAARAESADAFVISVPISSRTDGAGDLGNHVGVVPVVVPAVGPPPQRLAAIAGSTSARNHPTGRGASAALLGVGFRALARLGILRCFINHQRLVNTFVTNLRGPAQPLSLLGSVIDDVIVVSPIAGNVGVAFAALSYASTLTVTVIADPHVCPDLDVLARALREQLDALTAIQVPATTRGE